MRVLHEMLRARDLQRFWPSLLSLALAACAATQRGSDDLQLDEASPVAYEMCGMLVAPEQSPEVRAARAFFERAESADDPDEAATSYFAAAAELRKSDLHASPAVAKSRRIAYANGVNSWLNAGRVDAAHDALLSAAREDSALAEELHEAARRLPKAMRCTPPRTTD